MMTISTKGYYRDVGKHFLHISVRASTFYPSCTMLFHRKQGLSPRWDAANKAPHDGLVKAKPSSVAGRVLPSATPVGQPTRPKVSHFQRNVHVPQLRLPSLPTSVSGPVTDPIRSCGTQTASAQAHSARPSVQVPLLSQAVCDISSPKASNIDTDITVDDVHPTARVDDTPLFWIPPEERKAAEKARNLTLKYSVPDQAHNPRSGRDCGISDIWNHGQFRHELDWEFQRWMFGRGKKDMTKKLATNLKVLKMFFQHLDVEGKGSLGVRELEEPLVSVGLASSRDEVINLVAAADRNGSGALGFDEFIDLLSAKSLPHLDPRAAMELEERIRQAVVHLKNVSGGDVAEHLIDEEFVINELVKFRHAELRSSADTSLQVKRAGISSLNILTPQSPTVPKLPRKPRPPSPARSHRGSVGSSDTGGNLSLNLKNVVKATRQAQLVTGTNLRHARAIVVAKQHSARSINDFTTAPSHPESQAKPTDAEAQRPLVTKAPRFVDNPMAKLLQKLESGELGDKLLSFDVMIAAFRRKMLLDAAMAPPGSEAHQAGQRVLETMKRLRKRPIRPKPPQPPVDHSTRRGSVHSMRSQKYKAGRASVATIGSAVTESYKNATDFKLDRYQHQVETPQSQQGSGQDDESSESDDDVNPEDANVKSATAAYAKELVELAAHGKDIGDVISLFGNATEAQMEKFLQTHRKPSASQPLMPSEHPLRPPESPTRRRGAAIGIMSPKDANPIELSPSKRLQPSNNYNAVPQLVPQLSNRRHRLSDASIDSSLSIDTLDGSGFMDSYLSPYYKSPRRSHTATTPKSLLSLYLTPSDRKLLSKRKLHDDDSNPEQELEDEDIERFRSSSFFGTPLPPRTPISSPMRKSITYTPTTPVTSRQSSYRYSVNATPHPDVFVTSSRRHQRSQSLCLVDSNPRQQRSNDDVDEEDDKPSIRRSMFAQSPIPASPVGKVGVFGSPRRSSRRHTTGAALFSPTIAAVPEHASCDE